MIKPWICQRHYASVSDVACPACRSDMLRDQLSTALEQLEYCPDETARRISEWLRAGGLGHIGRTQVDFLPAVADAIERGEWRR